VELRHLRYFVAVAEELHFSRAAERLGMAQPPLSRQIQELEAELGFLLFERSRPRVGLTAAGGVLLEHARRVFEAINTGVRDARRTSLGERGRVNVGYPSSLAYSGLTDLLRAFRARFPDVDVGLRELPPAAQIEALKVGQIDVGFVRGPVDDAALASEIARRETFVLALPLDHPLVKKKSIALSSLALEPFVFFPRERGPAFFDQLVALCREAGFDPRIAHEAPPLDVLSLVAAGFGVSIVPSSVRESRRADVVLRPLIGAPVSELFIAWRPSDLSPSRHQFVELVRRIGVRKARRAPHARP
jgi:DNA-binding transcriptional LysR family regulator